MMTEGGRQASNDDSKKCYPGAKRRISLEVPEAIVNTAKFPLAQLIQLLQQAQCMLDLSSDLRPPLRLQRRGKSVALFMMTGRESVALLIILGDVFYMSFYQG